LKSASGKRRVQNHVGVKVQRGIEFRFQRGELDDGGIEIGSGGQFRAKEFQFIVDLQGIEGLGAAG
jgi:hypothetical protein